MATPPADLLILGGGIIGLTTAYRLARAGLRVEVCDRGDFGQEASWAGAGILPPGTPGHTATAIDALRAYGSRFMPAFAEELREATGIDNGYWRCGGIEVLRDEDRYAVDLWKEQRIAHELLTPERLRELEPHLTALDGEAYLLPDCAQLRNPWHLKALVAACRVQGVGLMPNMPVAEWVRDGERVVAVRFTNGEVRAASRFLVAAGAWSEALLKPLGHAPGVHPVLGQIVLYRPRQLVLTRVLMMGKEYFVPRADGRVLAGSTEEPEAGFEKRTTVQAFERLNAFACRVIPALADAVVEKQWAGLRPASADGLPYLGAVPGTANVFVATGHYRAGVQLSLGSAVALEKWILGEPAFLPPDDFRLDREPCHENRPTFRS